MSGDKVVKGREAAMRAGAEFQDFRVALNAAGCSPGSLGQKILQGLERQGNMQGTCPCTQPEFKLWHPTWYLPVPPIVMSEHRARKKL